MATQSVSASLEAVDPATLGRILDRIVVTGNERSRADFVIDQGRFEIGQPISQQALERARQRLLDTGLYQIVNLQTETIESGETVLNILLKEKRSWLLLPRLNRDADGDIKFGLRLRMYNLGGTNKSLQLLAQRENRSNGDTINEYRFGYDVPLYTQDLELQWRWSSAEKFTSVSDFDNIEFTDQVSIGLLKEWPIELHNASLVLSGHIELEEKKHQLDYPDTLGAGEPGNYNRLKVGLAYDAAHNERYRRFGNYYEISLSRGVDWLDSDYQSTVLELEAIGFTPLNDYDNFNYRFVFGLSNDSPFGLRKYSIGGASSLRGLEDFDERGDAIIYTNLEYLVAWRNAPQFSHTLFVDVGNLYKDWEAIDLADQKYTVGTGFRWKVDAFVKTDLFIDYGYDVEGKLGKLYGGTSLIF